MVAAALRLSLLLGTPCFASTETAAFLRFVGVDGTQDAWRPEGMNLYSDSGCSVRLPIDTATTFYSTKLRSDGEEEYTCPCCGATAAGRPCGDSKKDLGGCGYFGAETCQDGGSCPGGRCALVVGLPASTTVRCVKFWQNHLGSWRRFMDRVRVEYSSDCYGVRGAWTQQVDKSMPYLAWYQSVDIVFNVQTCFHSPSLPASMGYDFIVSLGCSPPGLISSHTGIPLCECMRRCDADSSCQAFEYTAGTGLCSVKSSNAFEGCEAEGTGKELFVRTAETTLVGHARVSPGCIGSNVGEVVVDTTPEGCAPIAEANRDYKAFTYAIDTPERHGHQGGYSRRKCVTAVRAVLNGCDGRALNSDAYFPADLSANRARLSACAATTTMTASTSSSTASASTSSTSSTTYLPKPTCTATRMRCPVPAHDAGSYHILGSEGQANCSLQGSPAAPYFDFAFGACNASRSFDEASATVLDTATLVYVPHSYGTLVTGASSGRQASRVSCVCESPMTAVVSQGLRSQEDGPGRARGITGAGDFQVTGSMHLSAAFDEPLTPGATLDPAAERLYLELRSSSSADVLGLESCVAAPSDSMTEPFAVEYLAAGCPAGPLDLRTHAEDEPHAARISILNFRFAGTTELHLWCRVVRCTAEPCGECGAGARRLRGLGSDEGQDEVLVGAFRTQRSAHVRILPGPLALLAASTLWRPAASGSHVAGLAAGLAGARSNLTLYGPPAELSEAFLEALASAVAQRASQLLARDLAVTSIKAVPASGRRLSSGQGLEALVLECLVALEQDGTRVAELLQDAGFQRLLAEGLEARVSGWASPLQLSFGALSWAAGAPTVAQQPLEGAEQGCWGWLLLVGTAAAGAAAGCLSLLALLQCRRWLLASRAALPEKQRASAKTEATEDTVHF